MVKVRMNTADVAAEVKCLKRLIGMRCSNVYDLTPKTYVFKLTNSSGITESGESEKVLLLMESGVRLHTTAYVRDKENTPSGFTLKLRKHIRNYRLEDVRQLGYDRIILFQFGLGTSAHYIILELYAQGNILLTDSEFTVLTLLRSHRDDNKGFATMSRHRYPIEMCRVFEPTTSEKLSKAFIFKEPEGNEVVKSTDGDEHGDKIMTTEEHKKKGAKPTLSSKTTNESSVKQSSLKMLLGDILGYGPALSEHIIVDAGLVPNTKFSKNDKVDDATITPLVQAVSRFEKWLEDVISGEKVPEGYILMQKKNETKDHKAGDVNGSSSQVYDEFCPLLLNQFKKRDYAKFDTFDAALDEFYSKYESQRVEKQQKAREDSAVHKLDKIRQDQENRVRSLSTEVDRCVKMAELIEYNLEDVDNAILAVRAALAKGMSWEDITTMVKEEKKLGNPVAGLIDKLYFERNCMTLLLSNNLDEMDDEERTLPVAKVEVDLALSAHANARRWYEMKKKQESKQEKTVAAHAKAFKAAEKKTRLQISQEKVAATIYHIRKVHWFEKFNWFISSENYLIISGRDAQQNEMIVKRYMSKEDLYVHADLHGASSTVIKNHRPNQAVPPLTLNQAGCFTVCHSQAWNSKIVISAWWVYPHQVSKTAPTGEYLTVGSFMIRGKKNFLPPHPLVMGFGILFRLDESSLASHLNERRIRAEEGLPSDAQDTLRFPSDPNSYPEVSEEKIESGDDTENPTIGEVENSLEKLENLLDEVLELGPKKLHGKSDEAPASVLNESKRDDAPAVRDKPHMSKSERRKLKKDQKSGTSEPSAEAGSEGPSINDERRQPPVVTDANRPAGGKVSRGHRSKLKKIKEKYADQDEEERTIRMALLGSAGTACRETVDARSDQTSPDEADDSASGSVDTSKVCYRCKKAGHLARECTEYSDSSKKSKSADATSIDEAANMEEDEVHEIGEDEKARLKDVDHLTGIPQAGDVLLYAVPVCGPYSALQSYKYRVKITPGTMKKGKAAKMAVNLFTHAPETTGREKELMKACTDPELVAALIGNVKVSASGLAQLKHKPKKGRPDKVDP